MVMVRVGGEEGYGGASAVAVLNVLVMIILTPSVSFNIDLVIMSSETKKSLLSS